VLTTAFLRYALAAVLLLLRVAFMQLDGFARVIVWIVRELALIG
jgi:hypothetical protein